MPSTLELALDYVSLNPGRRLFPIRPEAKHPPLITDNLEAASSDVDVIKGWHAKWPGCNWGLALRKSNLLVVDVDMKPGKNGKATYDDLDLQYGFPKTERVRSPSGGIHHYYSGTHVFGLGEHGFGPDVDSPNYVLIPGCTLTKGGNGTYETIPNGASIQPVPAWFYEILNAARQRDAVEQTAVIALDTPDIIERVIDYLKNDAKPSIEGRGGESQTFHTAGVCKDMGLSEPKCVELMAEYYNVPGTCDPLWLVGEGADSDRLDIKIRNAYAYLAEKAPGSDTATADFADAEMPDLPAMSKQAIKEHNERTGFREKDKERTANGEKERVWSRLELCEEWVYVCDLERFMCMANHEFMWKPDQFSNAFAYAKPAKETSLAKWMFSKSKGTIRKPMRLVYRPGERVFCNEGSEYNLWSPSKVVPAPGDLAFWHDHLAYLFPDEKIRGHVLDWLAWLIQNPGVKPKHALLIQGRVQGTGKSFIAEMLTLILGKDNVSPVGLVELDSQFNRWAMSTRLILVEELRALDSRQVAKKLHPMITQDRITINDKNQKTFPIDNCFGIFAMTNDEAAIPLDDSDRRYLVVAVGAEPRYGRDTPESFAYYHGLYARLHDAPSVSAIAYELMTRDLKGYDARQRAPYTAAKAKMIEAGLSDVERYMIEHAGEYPFGGRIVTVTDCIDSLPTRLQRTPRLENTVGSILANRFSGVRLGQHMVPSVKKRMSLWAINGTKLRGDLLGAMYDKDRESEHLAGATGAASDFGEAEDV